jgi:hypothetical protein
MKYLSPLLLFILPVFPLNVLKAIIILIVFISTFGFFRHESKSDGGRKMSTTHTGSSIKIDIIINYIVNEFLIREMHELLFLIKTKTMKSKVTRL